MCGTLWLAMFLYNFRKTPYLTRSRREWLADYALPASVLIMTFAGAYAFSEIDSKIIFFCIHQFPYEKFFYKKTFLLKEDNPRIDSY